MKRRDFLVGALAAPAIGRAVINLEGDDLPEMSGAKAAKDSLVRAVRWMTIEGEDGRILARAKIEPVQGRLDSGDTVNFIYTVKLA